MESEGDRMNGSAHGLQQQQQLQQQRPARAANSGSGAD